MVFYMPGKVDRSQAEPEELTPRQIVAELDRFIVGQDRAKRSVAIALRNRWRRKRVDAALGSTHRFTDHQPGPVIEPGDGFVQIIGTGRRRYIGATRKQAE